VQAVFIGDIQGCGRELKVLIERVRAECGKRGPVLHLVGDLVNRGPASLKVLRMVRPLVEAGRARVVMGNHELALIQAHLGIRVLGPRDTAREVLEAHDAYEWIAWLRGLPVADVGVLGGRPYAMVHAAVAPDWTLDDVEKRARAVEARLRTDDSSELRDFLLASPEDDPDRDALARFLRCRSVTADGHWSPEEPQRAEDAWHARWAERGHEYGVVYGHWATQGLHVAAGLRGLDTGCVHHGRGHDGHLTAWLPDASASDPFAIPDPGRLLQVRAKRAYYAELLKNIDTTVDSS
jgi:bis(5'-nucleosyl)-tetraphosphatase (symmetrical)